MGKTYFYLFIFFSVLAFLLIVIIFYLLFLLHNEKKKNKEQNHVFDNSDVKNVDKNNLVLKLAHDINTPLNVIMGMNYLALNDLNDSKNIKDCLDKANESAKYLTNLFNDLLRVIKLENNEIQIINDRFSFGKMLQEIVEITKYKSEKKQIVFNSEFDDKLFSSDYMGDKRHIYQMIMYIINDAVRNTLTGKSIMFSGCYKSKDLMIDEITLCITSDETNTTKEYLETIFEPFTRNIEYNDANDANGLGLTIAQKLVNLLNGKISVFNNTDKGISVVVKLFLPCLGPSKSNEELTIDEKDNFISVLDKIKDKYVLITEDNIFNQELLVNIIEGKYGLKTKVASNGKEAFDMFNSSNDGYYSLILMDIQMPYIDGLACAKLIRSSKHHDAKSIPIIAISANTYLSDDLFSSEAYVNDFLSKPINVEELSKIIYHIFINK